MTQKGRKNEQRWSQLPAAERSLQPRWPWRGCAGVAFRGWWLSTRVQQPAACSPRRRALRGWYRLWTVCERRGKKESVGKVSLWSRVAQLIKAKVLWSHMHDSIYLKRLKSTKHRLWADDIVDNWSKRWNMLGSGFSSSLSLRLFGELFLVALCRYRKSGLRIYRLKLKRFSVRAVRALHVLGWNGRMNREQAGLRWQILAFRRHVCMKVYWNCWFMTNTGRLWKSD